MSYVLLLHQDEVLLPRLTISPFQQIHPDDDSLVVSAAIVPYKQNRLLPSAHAWRPSDASPSGMEREEEGVPCLAGLRMATSKEQKQVQWTQCPGGRSEHRQGPGCNLSAVGHLRWTKLPPAQSYYICYLV